MKDMKNPEYSGFWIRLVAAILDFLIIVLPSFLLQWIIGLITGISTLKYVVALVACALVIYMEGIVGGTPGKLILGMKIVNEKGENIGIADALLRYIGKVLSLAILGVGYLMIGWDDKKQGLHDKLAQTFVVKR